MEIKEGTQETITLEELFEELKNEYRNKRHAKIK